MVISWEPRDAPGQRLSSWPVIKVCFIFGSSCPDHHSIVIKPRVKMYSCLALGKLVYIIYALIFLSEKKVKIE